MVNKRFLQTAERWKNPESPKPREKTHTSEPELTQILKRNENGKPVLNLTPLEKTAVSTPTQEDYWDLMRTYELGGWKWRKGESPMQNGIWDSHKETTCMEGGVDYYNGNYNEGRFGCSFRNFYLNQDWNVISTQEFYETQKITPEMLREINKWFDEQ